MTAFACSRRSGHARSWYLSLVVRRAQVDGGREALRVVVPDERVVDIRLLENPVGAMAQPFRNGPTQEAAELLSKVRPQEALMGANALVETEVRTELLREGHSRAPRRGP